MKKPLKEYVIDLYGKDGVEEACLYLQDVLGADVCLVLIICWVYGDQNGKLDFKRARLISRTWQEEVIGPIRTARRAIKSMDKGDQLASLYEELKQTELNAEFSEFAALEELVSSAPQGTENLEEILTTYLGELTELDEVAIKHIRTLIQAS